MPTFQIISWENQASAKTPHKARPKAVGLNILRVYTRSSFLRLLSQPDSKFLRLDSKLLGELTELVAQRGHLGLSPGPAVKPIRNKCEHKAISGTWLKVSAGAYDSRALLMGICRGE